MRNRVKTAFDVSFEYPLGRSLFSQYFKALFYRIGGGPSWSKAVRVRVRYRFRHWIKSEQVEGLHRPASHDGDAQGALLAVFLRDMNSSQWLGMVVPLSQRVDGIDLLVWSIPDDPVHSWGVLALVFRHSPDSKGFAAKRVGE